MSRVKMGHILLKQKKVRPNFLFSAKYIKNYQNINTKLKKYGGQFDLFIQTEIGYLDFRFTLMSKIHVLVCTFL